MKQPKSVVFGHPVSIPVVFGGEACAWPFDDALVLGAHRGAYGNHLVLYTGGTGVCGGCAGSGDGARLGFGEPSFVFDTPEALQLDVLVLGELAALGQPC